MPGLRANHSGDHDKRHHAQRVRIHAIPHEVLMQHDRCDHRCQPQQQPKRAQMHWAKIDIGKHNPRSLKYSDLSLQPSFALRCTSMPTSTPSFPAAAAMDILFSKSQIADRVQTLGQQISADYAGQSVVLIGVLKGAAIFLSDLARAIKDIDATFDFVAVSSYGRAVSPREPSNSSRTSTTPSKASTSSSSKTFSTPASP